MLQVMFIFIRLRDTKGGSSICNKCSFSLIFFSSFLLFLFVRAELERQRRLHAMEVQSVEEARYRLRAQLSNVRVDH